jgi:hypothetical protein
MNDCKTGTYEGKVYQLGGVYEFSDYGKDWALDELLSVGEGGVNPFEARQYDWKLIREVNYFMGTITSAPPEPKMAELFESDWRICSASGTYNMWSKMIDKGWKK